MAGTGGLVVVDVVDIVGPGLGTSLVGRSSHSMRSIDRSGLGSGCGIEYLGGPVTLSSAAMSKNSGEAGDCGGVLSGVALLAAIRRLPCGEAGCAARAHRLCNVFTECTDEWTEITEDSEDTSI